MYWMGLTSFSDGAKASQMAQKLLEKRLIACANIISGVSSHYRWNNQITSASETIMIFKTRKENVSKTISFIEKNHEYDTPVIETWPVGKTNAKAAQWVLDQIPRTTKK